MKTKNSRRTELCAVGTTSTRTLRVCMSDDDGMVSSQDKADGQIFSFIRDIKFKVIDALITNFHLPESTLLNACFCACRTESIYLQAYKMAVEEKYQILLSFGDAMLII